MDLNLQENELISSFDFGIQSGNILSNSEYFWCVNSKDNCLFIKNVRDKNETALSYHQFGSSADEKFSIITAKDFEYENQRYLVVSIEKNVPNKAYLLVLFKISVSKVICAFQVPYKVSQIEMLVKNQSYIHNSKNPTFFANFDVSCVCACSGGSIYIFDLTPDEHLYKLSTNESSPSLVYWYEGSDLTDYDDIREEKQISHHQSKIFGLQLNKQSVSGTQFKYMMPNDKITATLPNDLVKVTSLKYEKQIDSILVGFNFGCFQIWNMKTMTIESSSGYGENNKPVVGFSLLQPQHDPKKCLYLMVAHSKDIKVSNENSNKKIINKIDDFNDLDKTEDNIDNKSELEDQDKTEDNEFEIDEDDDETDLSFLLLYELLFERCSNIFCNQTEYYLLYEDLSNCSIAFQHEFSIDTLNCVKTNYSTEHQNRNDISMSILNCDGLTRSKIISIQTLNVSNNRLQLNLSCLIWALVDQSGSSSFYLSIFNLNNWYIQQMPSKMRPLNEISENGHKRFRKNIYFNNYTLSVTNEIDDIRFISMIDSKIKKIKNQNVLSFGNSLRKLLIHDKNEEYEYIDEEFDSNFDEETYLSMNFDLLVLTPFSLMKLSIKPIENQLS